MDSYRPNSLTCPVSLSFILINRLVLNLRRAGNINDSTIHSLTKPSFAEPEHSFLGNIGAPLRDGSESYSCEDEGDDAGLNSRCSALLEKTCVDYSSAFLSFR